MGWLIMSISPVMNAVTPFVGLMSRLHITGLYGMLEKEAGQ